MSALDDYIYAMEAMDEPGITASVLVAARLDVAATGTCGVTTPEAGLGLPVPRLSAEGTVRPAGWCPLPVPTSLATTAGWRPGWGCCALPLPVASGSASRPVLVDAVLPPLFVLSGGGAMAGLVLPSFEVASATRMDRRGTVAVALPGVSAVAYACSLDDPVGNAAGSKAVVALLGQADPLLALAAAALAPGIDGTAAGDVLAAALLAAVAEHLAYVADADGTDVWTCAAGTYFRGFGDCEDGAILLHGLLLAAGLEPGRLVTAFGRVGTDREGHAWVAYRRQSDGRYVALDWTLGPGQGAVAGLPVLDEPGDYALVDYALTSQAFVSVRQTSTTFFTPAPQVALALPTFDLAATASLGARATLGLGGAGWRGLGRCGAGGTCRPALLSVAGSAGSAVGRIVCAAMDGAGCSGAWGQGVGPVLAGLGLAGGSGRGQERLAGLMVEGAARLAVWAVGLVGLSRVRLAATGLGGLVGRSGCALPRPGPAATGLVGPVATGGAGLPAPDLAAEGTACLAGRGAAALPGALGLASASVPGTSLAGYVWNGAFGEEWA